MKISEMNNEQATTAMIRLAEPISNICDDEEAVKLFDELKQMENVPIIRAAGKMLPKFVQYALAKHKDDFFEIIGALTEKTHAEVLKMNFFETIRIVRESYDEVFSGFFTSSATQTKDSESK